MLALFPSLLSYQFFAIAIIRIAAALTLLYVAYRFSGEREEIARTKLPLVGHMPNWLSLLGSLVICAAGVLLIVGLYTQAAAIIGIIVGLKHAFFARKYPHLMPISAAAGILLFVMCLALLFLGAGALAFDLPL